MERTTGKLLFRLIRRGNMYHISEAFQA